MDEPKDEPSAPAQDASAPVPPAAQSDRFPCPQCGGELAWDPGAQKMRCAYCGSLADVPDQSEFHAK